MLHPAPHMAGEVFSGRDIADDVPVTALQVWPEETCFRFGGLQQSQSCPESGQPRQVSRAGRKGEKRGTSSSYESVAT